MINWKDNPVEWAMFMYELTDAQEHLADLIRNAESTSDFDENDFRIQLAHVYAHLNRAWFSRNCPTALSDEQWNEGRAFPKDIEPLA